MLILDAGKKIRNSLCILCTAVPSLLCFFSSSAFAARPLTTDDAGTVEKGEFQLEAGFNFARQENHDKELGPSMTLTYGIFERMDVGIGSGYLFVYPAEGKTENGFADTELKLKYRWIDEKDWKPAFATTGTLKFPTASESKGFGSGKTDFSINTTDKIIWDAGVELGMNKAAPDFRLTTGLTLLFKP